MFYLDTVVLSAKADLHKSFVKNMYKKNYIYLAIKL